MINRLLATLDSPRRHLIFLVSLLVLVFALTGVVAYRAIEADRSRSAAVSDVIERGLNRAAGEWASLYSQGVGSGMQGIAWGILHPMSRSAEITADAVEAALPEQLVCVFCARPLRPRVVFVLDLPSHDVLSATAPFDLGLARRAVPVLVADTVGLFTDRVRGVAVFDRIGDEVQQLLLFGIGRPGTDSIERAVGVLLSDESARDLLEASFAWAQQLTEAASVVDAVDSLYHRAAFVDGLRFMGDTIRNGSWNAPAAPVYGVEFYVDLRHTYALAAYDSTTKRLATIGLMVLIGGLLLIASVQIRRETVLMRLRADFVSSVSHELRTPLAQIRMFVETLLLGRTRSDFERQRSLEIIEQEARRLSHLVENVLLFSKTDGGRTPRIAPEPTDFAGDIRRAVDSFSLLSRAREAELRTELQENIIVQVDRGALRQILVNLIDNALKYGPSGQRVTVGAALFDDVARVWVDDEGPGIPDEARVRVFESFYRLPRELRAHVAGSGIGLAVVRELARLHDGDVWAEDAPGGGARIVVQFPHAYLRTQPAGGLAAAS
jgi:signal transduction histidine kinase